MNATIIWNMSKHKQNTLIKAKKLLQLPLYEQTKQVYGNKNIFLLQLAIL